MSIIEPGITELDLPIEMYDTTSDSSGLVVDRLHYFFDQVDQETLRVAELFIISNPGNKSVIPDETSGATLEFDLPADAENLEILDGEIGDRFIKTEEGFGDTFPIRPGFGEVQIMFAYDLPFDGNLELVRSFLCNRQHAELAFHVGAGDHEDGMRLRCCGKSGCKFNRIGGRRKRRNDLALFHLPGGQHRRRLVSPVPVGHAAGAHPAHAHAALPGLLPGHHRLALERRALLRPV